VGEHIAAVSPKPQTTRTRILGVVTRPDVQLALLDVPGVHHATSTLNKVMVDAALTAVDDVDVVLYLAEAGWPGKKGVDPETVDPVGDSHRALLAKLGASKKPVLLVLTKVDTVPRPLVLPVIDAWRKAFAFREIYPLSGLTGENVDGFVDAVRTHLPEGPRLYPEDTLTDQTERTVVAELVREEVFLQTRDEVPYGTAVEIDHFDESERGTPRDPEPAALESPAAAARDLPMPATDREAAYQAALASGADPLAALQELVAESEDDAFEDDDDDAFDDAADDDADDDSEAYRLPPDEEPADELESGIEGKQAVPVTPAAPRIGPGLVRIAATIVVERDSHKGIIIGKGGSRLKEIGAAARAKIEPFVGCRVWLELFVKVVPGWTEKRRLLEELGIARSRT